MFTEIRNIIEYVALDFEKEIQKAETTSDCKMTLKIHSSEPVVFNKERFSIPELLFKPQNNGLNCEGIDKAIYKSIINCKLDVQDELFSNIIQDVWWNINVKRIKRKNSKRNYNFIRK